MHLFEVNVKNRVTRRGISRNKPIRGRQGKWYTENLYYLADSIEEAKDFATDEIRKRRIIGILNKTKRKLTREIQIMDVRRLA